MATASTHKRKPCKNKLSRRIGENLWGRAKAPKRITQAPGQHGAGRRGKLTDYGVQLKEKQKLKGYYANINENQFRRIYDAATRRQGNSSENLVKLLEARLDALVYRLNFAATPFAARQLVNHKHVLVNGKVVNIPSYTCKPGDVIELRPKARQMAVVMGCVEKIERPVPSYLSLEPQNFKGVFIREPQFDEVPYAVQMNPGLVIELYSR